MVVIAVVIIVVVVVLVIVWVILFLLPGRFSSRLPLRPSIAFPLRFLRLRTLVFRAN